MTEKKVPWKWTEKVIVETYKMPNGRKFDMYFLPNQVIIKGYNISGNVLFLHDKKRIIIGDVNVTPRAEGIGTFALERLRQIAKSEGIKDFEIGGGMNTRYWENRLKMPKVSETISVTPIFPEGMIYHRGGRLRDITHRKSVDENFLAPTNPSLATFKKIKTSVATVDRNLRKQFEYILSHVKRGAASGHHYRQANLRRVVRSVKYFEKQHGVDLGLIKKRKRGKA